MDKERFLLKDEVKEALLRLESKIIMLIGGSDTGKTGLIEELLALLSKDFKVGVVDADIGQSHLGPPTTIAWGRIKGDFRDWERVPVEDFYFVGDISPSGNLLPTLAGTKIISDIAKQKVDKLLIDTTGMIRGGVGKALKIYKIDIIQPQIILALEREGELNHILISLRRMKVPRIFIIPVSPQVTQKTYLERVRYREKRFKSYFQDIQRISLSEDNISLRGLGGENYLYNNRLISLRNNKGKDLALGIIDEVDRKRRKISILTPLKKNEKIAGIVLGRIKINIEGKEMY
ncbi:MAG: Clp1/GlmU family protein [Candidatus Aerophobetes bacterium]|nr:Clp1/GlmU family protein [Candidatus Aerophobetes bacterium]